MSISLNLVPSAADAEASVISTLTFIQQWTGYLKEQSRRALQIFLNGTADDLSSPSSTGGASDGAAERFVTGSYRLSSIHDLERYADQWKKMVVDLNGYQCAALFALLGRQYRFTYGQVATLRTLLRLDSDVVAQAWQDLYQRPIQEGYQAAGIVHESATPDGDLFTAVEREVEWVTLEAGAPLLLQGEPSDSMYIIVYGRVRPVIRDENGVERAVSEKGRGDTIGEMTVLTGRPRTASVYAVRDTLLMRVPREAFTRLAARFPAIIFPVTRVVIDRLAQEQAHRNHPAPPSAIAIIPLVKLGEALHPTYRPFFTALREALGQYGRAFYLDRAIAARTLGETMAQALESDDSLPLRALLNDWETRYDFIVYEADASNTAWTRRCLRQADLIVYVAAFDDNPALSDTEQQIATRGDRPYAAHQELVLLHPPNAPEPRYTARWLVNRRLTAHHHVRHNNPHDLARLARSLTGNSIGVVLGGGGTRGAAHAGLLAAMLDENIPVDWVGGTSAGALAAAAKARDVNYAEGLSIIERLLVSTRDLTLPWTSFMAGKRYNDVLQAVFGDLHIEDLIHPFFCVSTNLTRAEMVVHRTGSLRIALRASGSVPGVFPPLLINGDLHVDGALLNNIPIDIMRQRVGGGTVIAVDIGNTPGSTGPHYRYGDSLSGWDVLSARLRDRRAAVIAPSIISVMMQASVVGSARNRTANRALADIYLTPPVEQFGMFEMKAARAMADIGYTYGREQAAMIRAHLHRVGAI